MIYIATQPVKTKEKGAVHDLKIHNDNYDTLQCLRDQQRHPISRRLQLTI